MKPINLILSFLLLLSLSCHNFFGPDSNGGGVNIYLLRDEGMTFEAATKQPLSELRLQEKPWISSDDIKRYDWSAHIIYLDKDIPISCQSISTAGKPFLVTANGERCYLGALWVAYSSFMMAGPKIWAEPGVYLDDIVCITFDAPDPQGQSIQDPRNDPRIKEALIANGQFHAGLQCTLEKVEVCHTGNASSVRYTYTLRNLDKDNLYVLDPDRMGTNLFHYFTNGVYLTNADHHYWAENKVVTAPVHWSDWELSWHSRLQSGIVMTRTVLLEGYPYIASGRYQCTFQFPSPPHIEKESRQLILGRIWIGRIDASVFILDVLSE
jgi:hypothetical protein